jgi:hypothetical protein
LFNSPTELLATALGPKTPSGQNLIPYQGQTTRAFGETVGRDIATEPFKTAGLPSLAGATIGGIFGGPIGAMAGAGLGAAANPLLRAAELYSLNKLGKTAGFIKGFPEQLAEARTTAAQQQAFTPPPSATTTAQAFTPPNVSGPVSPSNIPMTPDWMMKVTPPAQTTQALQAQMGQGLTNPATTNLMSTIRQTRPQLGEAPTPKEMAIQKTQEIVNQTAGQKVAPVNPNDILAQIRARGQQPSPGTFTSTAPTKGPFAQTTPINEAPTSSGSLFDPANFSKLSDQEKLSALRNRLGSSQTTQKPMSAAEEARAQREMTKQGAEAQKAHNNDIISDFASQGNSDKIDMIGQTIPIDKSKDVYNGSNATKGMAKYLLKHNVDSIPLLEGMTESQTVHAIYKEMTSRAPSKKGPSNVSQMLIDDSQSNSPDLLFSKLGQDRYKQLGPWKNEYDGINLGNETQASRVVMNKDGTKVTQAFDSEFGTARFEGKNKNGDEWMTEYEGSGNFGGRNAKVNSVPEYSDDLSIINPNNIKRQKVTYKDGRTFERSSILAEPELTYYNPKTGNSITFDENGNVLESIKIGKKEQTLSDGSKRMFDDYSNTTPMTPEIDKFPNLENVIDNFEFPTKTTQAPKNVSKMLTGEDLPSGISSLSKEATGKVYASKAEYDKANLFNTLQENVPRASYIEGDKLITIYEQNIPADLRKVAGIEKMAKIVRDAKTGKVIKD